MKRHPCFVLAFAWVCGCGSGPPDMGPPPLGAPIAAAQDQWTWVDFPDSACDDGSTTGVGIYNSSLSQNVLVFMNGGGACWDYGTCYLLNTASHGPFQQAQFDGFAAASHAGTIFDRAEARNPFKDWSYVVIPYCTGDVHAGNNVIVYTNGAQSATYHHVGHANILAYLKRLGPTFPSPAKLVVSGASAGGYGTLFNYPSFRWYWPKTETYLLDDSGPPLEKDAIPPNFQSQWLTNWGMDKLLDQFCGAPCKTDFSEGVPTLVRYWPNDRMALLSSLQDQTISGYFLLGGDTFQDLLLTMAHDRMDPTSHFRYFFVAGNSHTMVGGVSGFTSGTTPLWTWLTQQVTNDPAWTSTMP